MAIKQDPYQRMSVCYGQQQPGQQLQLQVQPTQQAQSFGECVDLSKQAYASPYTEKKFSHSTNGRMADGPESSMGCTSAMKASPAPRKKEPTIIVRQPTMEEGVEQP